MQSDTLLLLLGLETLSFPLIESSTQFTCNLPASSSFELFLLDEAVNLANQRLKINQQLTSDPPLLSLEPVFYSIIHQLSEIDTDLSSRTFESLPQLSTLFPSLCQLYTFLSSFLSLVFSLHEDKRSHLSSISTFLSQASRSRPDEPFNLSTIAYSAFLSSYRNILFLFVSGNFSECELFKETFLDFDPSSIGTLSDCNLYEEFVPDFMTLEVAKSIDFSGKVLHILQNNDLYAPIEIELLSQRLNHIWNIEPVELVSLKSSYSRNLFTVVKDSRMLVSSFLWSGLIDSSASVNVFSLLGQLGNVCFHLNSSFSLDFIELFSPLLFTVPKAETLKRKLSYIWSTVVSDHSLNSDLFQLTFSDQGAELITLPQLLKPWCKLSINLKLPEIFHLLFNENCLELFRSNFITILMLKTCYFRLLPFCPRQLMSSSRHLSLLRQYLITSLQTIIHSIVGSLSFLFEDLSTTLQSSAGFDDARFCIDQFVSRCSELSYSKVSSISSIINSVMEMSLNFVSKYLESNESISNSDLLADITSLRDRLGTITGIFSRQNSLFLKQLSSKLSYLLEDRD
ncbi:hypothetical protein P9112_004249 [Eukaryota sp. TZLM1-RC]